MADIPTVDSSNIPEEDVEILEIEAVVEQSPTEGTLSSSNELFRKSAVARESLKEIEKHNLDKKDKILRLITAFEEHEEKMQAVLDEKQTHLNTLAMATVEKDRQIQQLADENRTLSRLVNILSEEISKLDPKKFLDEELDKSIDVAIESLTKSTLGEDDGMAQ